MSETTNTKYNREAFEETCAKLDAGDELTFEMIGDVFGKNFWIPLVYTLLDAQDAARAIAGAINGLRAGKSSEERTNE